MKKSYKMILLISKVDLEKFRINPCFCPTAFKYDRTIVKCSLVTSFIAFNSITNLLKTNISNLCLPVS